MIHIIEFKTGFRLRKLQQNSVEMIFMIGLSDLYNIGCCVYSSIIKPVLMFRLVAK